MQHYFLQICSWINDLCARLARRFQPTAARTAKTGSAESKYVAPASSAFRLWRFIFVKARRLFYTASALGRYCLCRRPLNAARFRRHIIVDRAFGGARLWKFALDRRRLFGASNGIFIGGFLTTAAPTAEHASDILLSIRLGACALKKYTLKIRKDTKNVMQVKRENIT